VPRAAYLLKSKKQPDVQLQAEAAAKRYEQALAPSAGSSIIQVRMHGDSCW
jgi:hypothetical protein